MNKKYNRTINFIMIIGGGITALLAQTDEPNNQYLIIGGAILLMVGIYRASRNIPNNPEPQNEKQESIIDHSFNENELDEATNENNQEAIK